MTYSNSYRYQSDRIEFSETDEERARVMRYILEAVDTSTTRLTLEYYLPKRLPGQVLFRLLSKAKTERALERSLQNLASLVKEIRLPKKGAAP
jgi:hypothetical protein